MRYNRFTFAALLLAAIYALSCREQRPAPGARHELRIGCLVALSGDAADWGRDEERGAELAVRDFLSTHHGVDVKLVTQNAPATDISAVVTAFRHLLTIDKVEAVVGPTWDDAAAAIAPLADEDRVVVIAPDASSGVEKHVDRRFFFSDFTPETTEVKRLTTFLRSRQVRKVACVYNRDPFSQQWHDAFVKVAANSEMTVVMDLPVSDPESKNFRAEITRLKSISPDAIYLEFASQDTKGPFLRQAHELGLTSLIVSSSTSETSSLLKGYGAVLDGLTYAYPANTAKREAFTRSFVKQYGAPPTSPAAPYAYDATMLLLSLQQNGPLNSEQLRNALIGLKPYDGVTAQHITFSPTGRVQWPEEAFVMKTIKGGAPIVIQSAAVSG